MGLPSGPQPSSFLLGETKFLIRDAVHRLGAEGIDAALAERKKKGYQGSSIVCPECGCDAKFQNNRSCSVTTLLGSVVYERAYYEANAAQFQSSPFLRIP